MDNQTVGERIRMVRKLNKLSGKGFAGKLRITQPYVSRIERGIGGHPSAKLLHAISLEFNISENWLLTGSGEMAMQTKRKGNTNQFHDENIIKMIQQIRTELEEVQKKMEIGRANSQPPEDSKSNNNKNSLPSSTIFCNPEQDIENCSNSMKFPQRLKALRKQKGVTQIQMSEVLGVSRSSYVKYEHGERELGYAKLAVLADYFNVSIDILLGRT